MKRRTHIIYSILILILFTSCTPKKQAKIYDDNNKIVETTSNYTAIYWHAYGDLNSVEYKLNLTGIFTIWQIESEQDRKITLDILSEFNNEDIKVVLINSQNEVINLSEGNFEKEIDINILKGNNRIKFVSKGSKGNLKMEISEYEGINLRRIDLER